MEYLSGSQTNGMPMPPGVMAITDIKAQKRATRTLSKAVSLHLEGKLEAAGPPRPETMLGLGIALIHAGRPAESLTPLEKYLSLYPEHEQALFGQAVALQQTGKHAEAVEQYRKVLEFFGYAHG